MCTLDNFISSAKAVPLALTGDEMSPHAHNAAIRFNKQRMELKAKINALCGAPYDEVKNYYGQN